MSCFVLSYANVGASLRTPHLTATHTGTSYRAEVCQARDLLQHASYAAAKESGCMRTEGRDYGLVDGEVVCVKWK